MFSIFTRLLPTKLWGVFGGIILVFSTIWYIQHLRNEVEAKDMEISSLNFAINEVAKVYQNNLQELEEVRADQAIQLDLLEHGFMKFNENTAVVQDIEARIKYAKPEDDGLLAPIFIDTIRLLREATVSSNRARTEEGSNP